jgi:hypothetical protein
VFASSRGEAVAQGSTGTLVLIAGKLFWSHWGTPLLNAMLNAGAREAMTRWPDWGFKRMNTNVLHLYTECPEGKIIAIAKRDSVNTMDPEAMKGLELCEWCRAKEQG